MSRGSELPAVPHGVRRRGRAAHRGTRRRRSSSRLPGLAARALTSSRPSTWPSVGVVVVTRDRPNLLRRALESVYAQDYPGPLRVVVVYDGVCPDWRVARGGERPVLVLENWRAAGLAGARNTGILAVGDCELVAFCDDDDTWAPAKLTTQVSLLRERPGTLLVTCAAEVEYDGRRTPRLAGLTRVDVDALTPERAAALRPSSYVARQDALARDHTRGGIGLIAEDAPPGGEDWDLLLRAAGRAPIAHVDAPLVRVLWRARDLDPIACADEIQARYWLLDRHTSLGRAWLARVYADVACWEAACGDRSAAREWAVAALRARWRHPGNARAVLAAVGVLRGVRLRSALARHWVP